MQYAKAFHNLVLQCMTSIVLALFVYRAEGISYWLNEQNEQELAGSGACADDY